jgi:3-oxoacyl-[acyl-carrier protein] reductase
MDLGIAGKTAVVTAASSGLGRAIAEGLAAEGVNLVLFARRKELLDSAKSEIEGKHRVRVDVIAGDMTKKEDVARLTETAKARDVHILIMNTGRPPAPMRELLDETDDTRWEEAYQVQLWGGVMVLRAIVPLLVAKGWGRVVAVTSATVKQPMIRHGLSTVYRTGMQGFLKQLANEVAKHGVTVNSVCPASVETGALRANYDLAARAKTIPLQRIGKPEELAATVAFLASERAGFTTGATLQVDGGQTASLI